MRPRLTPSLPLLALLAASTAPALAQVPLPAAPALPSAPALPAFPPQAAPASAFIAAPARPDAAPRPAEPRASEPRAAELRAPELRAPEPRAAEARSSEEIDDTALRYYASLRQTERVEAETRRLRRLHPGWTVPEDLYTQATGNPDEAPLWELFGADRLDELAAAIAARQAASPTWRPSDDLARKWKTKDLRRKIMAAARAEQWKAVADLSRAEGFVVARDVEVLWVVADAYSRTNRSADAFALYRAILQTSDAPDQRQATIQKALAALRLGDAEQLISMGRGGEGGRHEFEPIGLDITRARISGYLHDERPEEIAGPELAAFQDYAAKAADPNQPGLVAWYHFKRRDHANAFEWFKQALGRGGDAMVAHGLAHTLRLLGKTREAEEVAYAWREPLVNNAILFIDLLESQLTKAIPPFIEPERIARYAQVTVQTGSGEGAQALGWYAYNSCQFDVALDWFGRAVAWLPKEATVYGYALTLRRLGRQREFLEVANRYDGLFPKVVELVFPDGREQPPTPCDPRSGARPTIAGGELQAAAGVVQDPLRRHQWGRVPHPAQPHLAQPPEALRPKRGEFPVAVSHENPLRFGTVNGPGAARPVAAPRETGAPQLVARRVPGVGPMPYERYGYALLAGWNGVDRPTLPTSAEQSPPAGTLWAEEVAAESASAMMGGGWAAQAPSAPIHGQAAGPSPAFSPVPGPGATRPASSPALSQAASRQP